jgi:hypothetical protein
LQISRHLVGHASSTVILTHYDDPVVQAELDAAVAFWQNCIQAHLLSGKPGVRTLLSVQDEDLEWFRNLSVVAGIASSLQVTGRKVTVSEREYLEFEQSPEAFKVLYLVKQGALAARRRVGDHRWRVQGIPILAYVRAIRRHLVDAGLIGQYIDAARLAFQQLQSGLIVLPLVMDD